MRSVFVTLLFLAVIPNVGAAQATQQIVVKLVDGRNGRSLKNGTVVIWLGEKDGMPNQTLRTNTEGITSVPIPAQQTSFVIGGQSLVDCRMRVRYGKVVIDEG